MTWPTRDNSFECFYIPETDSLDHCRSALKAFASVSGWWYWRFYAFPHSAAPHIPEYAPLFQRWAGITFISSGTETGRKTGKTFPKFRNGSGKGLRNSFPKFSNGNRRLSFLGMDGNRNGNGKTIFPQKSARAIKKDAKFFSHLMTPYPSLLFTPYSLTPFRNKGILWYGTDRATKNIQMRVYLTIFQFPFCSVMWISKFRKNGKETKQKYSQNSGMGGEWIKPNYGSGKGMKKSILKIWEHDSRYSRTEMRGFHSQESLRTGISAHPWPIYGWIVNMGRKSVY